jgi:hypothetical protein
MCRSSSPPFSGLYFTVYAVTDATYRAQFFTGITDDLEKAVGVRAAYQALCAPDLRRFGIPAHRLVASRTAVRTA